MFARLAADRRGAIEQACQWRTVQPAEHILRHQDSTRDVFFVVSGRARSIIYAASGAVVAFGDLPAGSMFGEIAAIDGQPRAVGVEAVEACTVACLPHQTFLSLVRSEPEFAVAILEQIAANIRRLTERVFEFSTLTVNKRIHAELLRLAKRAGTSASRVATNAAEPIVIAPAPTHSQLAASISTQREAVTRELNRLAKLGILRKTNSALIIADFDRLSQLVTDHAVE